MFAQVCFDIWIDLDQTQRPGYQVYLLKLSMHIIKVLLQQCILMCTDSVCNKNVGFHYKKRLNAWCLFEQYKLHWDSYMFRFTSKHFLLFEQEEGGKTESVARPLSLHSSVMAMPTI